LIDVTAEPRSGKSRVELRRGPVRGYRRDAPTAAGVLSGDKQSYVALAVKGAALLSVRQAIYIRPRQFRSPRGSVFVHKWGLTLKNYILEIYTGGSIRDVWAYFESDSPFGSISAGDLLIPSTAPDATPATRLKVKMVEHAIWQNEGGPVRHKIMVFGDLIEAEDSAWRS
jgi:hypothetical protein